MAMSEMGEVWGLKVLVMDPVRMSTTRTDKLRDAITAVRESGATAMAVMGSPSCDSNEEQYQEVRALGMCMDDLHSSSRMILILMLLIFDKQLDMRGVLVNRCLCRCFKPLFFLASVLEPEDNQGKFLRVCTRQPGRETGTKWVRFQRLTRPFDIAYMQDVIVFRRCLRDARSSVSAGRTTSKVTTVSVLQQQESREV